MENQNRYKIEVKWDRRNTQTREKEIIPLPEDKVTGITWDALVKVIAGAGVSIADQIRLHNIGQKGGTWMLDRSELFSLWKQVEACREKNRAGVSPHSLRSLPSSGRQDAPES